MSLRQRWSVGVGGQGGLEYEESETPLQAGQGRADQGEKPAVPCRACLPVKGKERGGEGREGGVEK